jgi:hypothetical protein
VLRVQKQIAATQDEIHVLNAEWSFLNQPNRLADLSRKYLNLQPIGTAQYGQMGQLSQLKQKQAPAAEPLAATSAPLAAGITVAGVKRTSP